MVRALDLVAIDDPRVVAVPIVECRDRLEDLRATGLRADESRASIQRMSDNPFLARASVIERLRAAQARLPAGIALEIKEAWRPLAVQAAIYEHYVGSLQRERPALSSSEIRAEAARYVAPPDIIPPHSTGGAIDLVLVDARGPLDMGWGFNEPGPRSATRAVGLSSTGRRNRSILVDAMEGAGFTNYPHEWWHWSFGDRYWAWVTRTTAIFGSL